MTKIPNLFVIMTKKGISQKQLAKNIGASTGNVADWKSGRSAPSIDKLPLIADYLEVSVDYLLGRSEPAAPTLDPESAEILDMYGALTAEQQQFIKITIQGLLSANEAAALEKRKMLKLERR